MRILFVVPPLTGHVNPTVSIAAALAARGHEVAWVGHPGAVRPRLPAGAELFALDDRVAPELADRMRAEAARVVGAARLKFLWEEFFVPLARAMRPGVEAAVDALFPDLLVVDQQAIAGGLVARRRGLPWATLATTSAGVVDPLAGLPAVRAWHAALIAALEREAGLLPAPRGELSPHLVVALTTEALVGPVTRFPAHYRFVGPALAARPEPADFPWDALAAAPPRLLVSLGTVNAHAGARFFAQVAEGLGGLPMQVILAAPPEAAPSPSPANFLVRPFVPQLALLPHVQAVLCHGGHNTVVEALAHGLPLVVAPIVDDQPVIAQQVADAGAGLRIKFARAGAATIREAVHQVLGEPGFRAAAARVQASFVAAGGAARAAQLLEGLR